jgi:hypothetical protein
MVNLPFSVQLLVETAFVEELLLVFFKWAGATLIFFVLKTPFFKTHFATNADHGRYMFLHHRQWFGLKRQYL